MAYQYILYRIKSSGQVELVDQYDLYTSAAQGVEEYGMDSPAGERYFLVDTFNRGTVQQWRIDRSVIVQPERF